MLRIGHGAHQTAYRLLVPAARQRAEVPREVEQQALLLRRLEAAAFGAETVVEVADLDTECLRELYRRPPEMRLMPFSYLCAC